MKLNDRVKFRTTSGDDIKSDSTVKTTTVTPKKTKITSYKSNNKPNDEVIAHLTQLFDDKSIIGKSDFIVFSKTNTLLGNPLKSSDKIINVNLINDKSLDCKFISISFRVITYREIKNVSKEYVIIRKSGIFPTLVKREYIEDPKYANYAKKLYEQFT